MLLSFVAAVSLAATSIQVREPGNGVAHFFLETDQPQQYVELFVRRNGVQVMAQEITASRFERAATSFNYHLELAGFVDGDAIEYRFYAHANGAQLFVPGPTGSSWETHVFGPPKFVTSDRTFSLGEVNGVRTEVHSFSARSVVVPAGRGWLLRAAVAPSLVVPTPAGKLISQLVGIYVRRCGTDEWVNANPSRYLSWAGTQTSTGTELRYFPPQPLELPGTQVDPQFECGGRQITVPTLIGPQTLTTDADVEFALVIEHR